MGLGHVWLGSQNLFILLLGDRRILLLHFRECGLVVEARIDRGTIEGIPVAQVEVMSALAHLTLVFGRDSKLVGLALLRVRRDVRRAESVSLFCQERCA